MWTAWMPLPFVTAIPRDHGSSATRSSTPAAAVKHQRSRGVPTALSGLKLWLRGDSLSALGNGDPVSTWADESGQGHDFAQTGGARPTYQTGVLNGDVNAGALSVASGARMRGRAEFGWSETGSLKTTGRN